MPTGSGTYSEDEDKEDGEDEDEDEPRDEDDGEDDEEAIEVTAGIMIASLCDLCSIWP